MCICLYIRSISMRADASLSIHCCHKHAAVCLWQHVCKRVYEAACVATCTTGVLLQVFPAVISSCGRSRSAASSFYGIFLQVAPPPFPVCHHPENSRIEPKKLLIHYQTLNFFCCLALRSFFFHSQG